MDPRTQKSAAAQITEPIMEPIHRLNHPPLPARLTLQGAHLYTAAPESVVRIAIPLYG